MSEEVFDYVIVGGGSAGCVLASRLSEGGQATVLLLEAGGSGDKLDLRWPPALVKPWGKPRAMWDFVSEPQRALDGRRLPVPRAKILGGASALDGMVALRGQAADYDGWRDGGLPGWGHADVLPYFRRLESHWLGDTDLHGGHGPVAVTRAPMQSPLTERARAAARAQGLPLIDDVNGRAAEGLGLPDWTIARGHRVDAAAAYLGPAAARRNLKVRTGARVNRVIVIDGIARGVAYYKGFRERAVAARREVILCAGAIGSPKLLLLSGIGPAEALRAHGIPVVADRAEVGANLRDHAQAEVRRTLDREWAFERHLRLDRVAVALVRWAVMGEGALAAPPVVLAGNVVSLSGSSAADLHVRLLPLAAASRLWFPLVRPRTGPVLRAIWSLNHPVSRGSVRLRAPDPVEAPAIDLDLLGDPDDQAALARGYCVARALLAEPPLAEVLGPSSRPPEPDDDDAVLAWLRATVTAAGRPSGTCRMGSDEGAVVDGSLRVRGVKRLRVIDASVFPTPPAGASNLPVLMIAEEAADQMRGRTPPPS